jgi:hypothetical protein
MKLLNFDQVPRVRALEEKAIIREFLTRALIAFILFAIMATAVTLHAIESVQASAIAQADQPDFMLSTDYLDYMHRYGTGMIFNDQDME